MEQLDTLEKAIDLFRSGDKAAASRLLAQQVTQSPQNDTAWMWLAVSLEQPDQQVYCLKKAQALNPAAPATLEALKSFLGLVQPVREAGNPINLPPPVVPVRPVALSDSPTGPIPQVQAGKKVLSRAQVIILLVLSIAILIVIAVLGYFVISASPDMLPPFLRSIVGSGGLVLP
jgi:hypothetical protein